MQTKYEALLQLISFRQGWHMSTSDFLARFKVLKLVAKRLSNKVGKNEDIIGKLLDGTCVDCNNLTNNEMGQAAKTYTCSVQTMILCCHVSVCK